nr:hypothetical protein [Rickettsia asembonensis]
MDPVVKPRGDRVDFISPGNNALSQMTSVSLS